MTSRPSNDTLQADAHTAARLKTNHVYGNIFRNVYETLVGELAEEITDSEDMRMVRIKGYDFLIINNWLLYPLRVGVLLGVLK